MPSPAAPTSVLYSVHKIVGRITQSAILHVSARAGSTSAILDRSVTLVESTSPNSLLTASLDAARAPGRRPR